MDLRTGLTLLAVLLGHGAVHTYAHNRLNARGWPRGFIKIAERFVHANFLLLPLLLAWLWSGRVWEAWISGADFFQPIDGLDEAYAAAAIVGLILLVPGWLVGRYTQWSQRRHRSLIRRMPIDVDADGEPPIFGPGWLRTLAKLPGNQVGELELTIKRLRVAGLPPAWVGLKIGHLSDFHLTGWYHDRYYKAAVQAVLAQGVDLCCFTGDLVDVDETIEAAADALRPFDCEYGQYFVLGNHDRRVTDPNDLRKAMKAAGWTDLGEATCERPTPRGPLQLLGNELPWFDLASRRSSQASLLGQPFPDAGLRIGLAHSPDQWTWGMRCHCDLLLCGHTHGGQVRLPLIGPIISPSDYGSRYASGIFRLGEQTVHVSRGLSGTQPLRINCRPEVSVLILEAEGRTSGRGPAPAAG